jgi:LuxR family maltose regulon positive regulatory protein
MMANTEDPTSALSSAQTPQRLSQVLAGCRAYLENGQIQPALHLLSALQDEAITSDRLAFQFASTSTLGEICVKQGKLHLAAATYQFLLDRVNEQDQSIELLRLYYGLCDLYYEWNHLEKASQYLQGCLQIAEEKRLPPSWVVAGLVRLAWIRWAQDNANAAQALMQQAWVSAEQTKECSLVRQVQAQQARLWLRRGQMELAQRWATDSGLPSEGNLNYRQQFEYLTLARVLIAQGAAAQTLPLLHRLQRAATADSRAGDLIEILVVKALALQAQGNRQAWTVLAQALCRAEHEEYLRTFTDEGWPLVALLQQTAAKGVTLRYGKNLLATLVTALAPGPAPLSASATLAQPVASLIEPLTQREQEVLQWVAAGYANEEIARLLSISPTTVKKHLSNLFGKLGAKNRTAAVAKARALHLL